jgi:hypothetical protein
MFCDSVFTYKTQILYTNGLNVTEFSILTEWRSISLVKMLLKSVVFSDCILKYIPRCLAKSVVFLGAYFATDKNENPVLK